MTTRIDLLTLLGITFGLAQLAGCDDPTGADGIDESDSDSDSDSGSDSGFDSESDTDDSGSDGSEADDESSPDAPALHLVSTPKEERSPSAPINFALGKPTTQSSTYGGAGASLAVDGNFDGQFGHGSVTHTSNEGETWWQVDLQTVQPVGEIVISNRTDCCSDRLHDFTVQVSADGVQWEVFAYDGVAKAKARVLIDRPVRWVKIINPETLSLAEVEVFETRNLAYGKATSQSSTAYGGDAARAIDGNTDGNYPNNSVTHTAAGAHEWWQVDLGSIQAIGQAVVFNRTDCCADRLHDFTLRVSNDMQNWFDIPISGVAGPQVVIPVNREGRYVRVVNGGDPLQLAEVQLFEAPRMPGLSYGRGVGTIPGFGCGAGDQQDGLLCYPTCAAGYYGVGPVCWQACTPGFYDMGAYCINYWAPGWPSYWKGSYGRGVGTPLISTCGVGNQYDAGLCYPECGLGYKGVGPVCWLESISIGSIAAGACDLLRVPFMSALADGLDQSITAGVGLGVSAVGSASAELGVAYGDDGEFGCYVSGCAGFSTGVALSAYATAGAYQDFETISGFSTVLSAGASIGIPETPISFGGTLGMVSDENGQIGSTISVSVNLSEPTPIDLSINAMVCETAMLQTQG